MLDAHKLELITEFRNLELPSDLPDKLTIQSAILALIGRMDQLVAKGFNNPKACQRIKDMLDISAYIMINYGAVDRSDPTKYVSEHFGVVDCVTAISNERDYQDEMSYVCSHNGNMSLHEEIILLKQHVNGSLMDAYKDRRTWFSVHNEIRKIAAIALRALSNNANYFCYNKEEVQVDDN